MTYEKQSPKSIKTIENIKKKLNWHETKKINREQAKASVRL